MERSLAAIQGASNSEAVRRLPLFVAGATLLAAASAYRGFFDLFSYFAQYDDTGCMLSTIQGFNEHGGLYKEIFTCMHHSFRNSTSW
jgi:hypothetical protein